MRPRRPTIDGAANSTLEAAAMERALIEAELAARAGDVPVGAVVLLDGEIIATGRNEREIKGDPTAHAEVLALQAAAAHVGEWRLERTTLVVTLEPCAMCAGAAVHARVERLVFGAYDPKAGAAGSIYNLCNDPRLNHEIDVVGGVEERRCSDVLRQFFSVRRGEPSPTRHASD